MKFNDNIIDFKYTGPWKLKKNHVLDLDHFWRSGFIYFLTVPCVSIIRPMANESHWLDVGFRVEHAFVFLIMS